MFNLESFMPFSTLPKENLESLAQITTFKTYTQKEIIHYEGDTSLNLYFLLKGAVKFYKVGHFDNEIFLGILESGLLVDFSTPKKNFISFCNLECTKQSLVAICDGRKLHKLLMQDSKLLHLFFIESTQKLQLLKEVIQKELIFDSTAKLAHMLFHQLHAFNARKKQDNAAFLNIQPETLSRILNKLRRDNILATDAQGKIKVLDSNKLREIFKG